MRLHREPTPRFVAPMLASAGAPPNEDRWAAEVKWDGIRAQFRLDGSWCVRSRPGRDCSDEFRELAVLATELRGRRALLDGELVVLGPDGKPDFHRLRQRLHPRSATRLQAEAPATYVAFDVLHLSGRSTLAMPYTERRKLLTELLANGERWRVPDHFTGDDALHLADVTAAHGLEGVVCKRLDSTYAAGRRTRAWIKHKNRRRETFAITGFTPGDGEPDTIYLARDTGTRLQPVGPVQYGLSTPDRERLRFVLRDRSSASRRRSKILNVRTGVSVVVDFHGPPHGPLRDPVMRELITD